MARRPLSAVASLQAAYYAVTAAWAIFGYRSFEMVTGRKREPWLVKTVAMLMLAIAGSMAADVRRGDAAAARPLGIGSALAFGLVDVWYAGVRRRISRVYLLDAVVQLLLIGAWAAASRSGDSRTLAGAEGFEPSIS